MKSGLGRTWRPLLVALVLVGTTAAGGQRPLPAQTRAEGASVAGATPPAAPPVERLEDGRLRVERILVDTVKGELSLSGFVNSQVTVLEYLANARDGAKDYETALELDASALAFNVALLLLGLDDDHGVPSKRKFDPDPPAGDAVEVWVRWEVGGQKKEVRGEDLIYDEATKKTLPHGPWVYTGSLFDPGGWYLADVIGILIGFMHTPESIIDSPLPLESGYGNYVLNPWLGLRGGMPVEVVVKVARKGAAP